MQHYEDPSNRVAKVQMNLHQYCKNVISLRQINRVGLSAQTGLLNAQHYTEKQI